MSGTKDDICVMYVEDDQQASELLEKLLRIKYPAAIFLTATNGEQGLQAFREHHPDVVVTDINMPGTSGIEMAKRMRRMVPEALIIAVSAYHDGEIFEEAKKVGFTNYVTKPVEYRKLLAAIDAAVELYANKNS